MFLIAFTFQFTSLRVLESQKRLLLFFYFFKANKQTVKQNPTPADRLHEQKR